MAFLVKSIRPRKINVALYESEIEAALLEEGRKIKRLYDKTTETWSPPKPKFVITTSVSSPGPRGGRTRRSAAVSVTTDDLRYKFVDEGTRIRWAVMSRDFRPKTRRGVIGSRRGRGGPVIIGKRAMRRRGIRPRPGIQARRFTPEITKRRRRDFQANMAAAMSRATRRAFSG